MMRFPIFVPKNLFSALLFVGLFFTQNLSGQDIIGRLKLDDCSVEKLIYPYGWIQYAGDYHEVGFTPTIKLNESDFAYLWKPQFKIRMRKLSVFNLLMEKKWEVDIELEEGEDIFSIYRTEENITLLSYEFNALSRFHRVTARNFKVSDGSFVTQKYLYQFWGKSYQVLGYDFSADSSKLVFYHFTDDVNSRKVKNILDYPYANGGAGFKVTNSKKAHFLVYDTQLDTVAKGEMELVSWQRAKSFVVDGQVDDEGHVVFSLFQEPNSLHIHRFNIETQKKSVLSHQDFPDPFDRAPYGAMLPPYIGKNGQIYAAYAGRERIRGRRYTRYFKVVNFDFEKEKIDSSRTIPITSSFQVQLNKSREAVNLRPETIFDHYLIRDLIEMKDGRLWMIAQKYETGSQPKRLNAMNVNMNDVFVSTMEEILLFEFEPDGKIHKVIMIPMFQQAILPLERVGRFYTYHIDKEEQVLHMITREFNGEKHTNPPRIFYRKIDLETGTYTDRQQIFSGDRRAQFYLRDYTLFLNPFVAILTVVDGDMEDNPEIISVRLESVKK